MRSKTLQNYPDFQKSFTLETYANKDGAGEILQPTPVLYDILATKTTKQK